MTEASNIAYSTIALLIVSALTSSCSTPSVTMTSTKIGTPNVSTKLKSIHVEHWASGSEKKREKTTTLDNQNSALIWNSTDGVECFVTPWGQTWVKGKQQSFYENKATFECRTGDWRNTITIDCDVQAEKNKAANFFIGGNDKYNQNFAIWCE